MLNHTPQTWQSSEENEKLVVEFIEKIPEETKGGVIRGEIPTGSNSLWKQGGIEQAGELLKTPDVRE